MDQTCGGEWTPPPAAHSNGMEMSAVMTMRGVTSSDAALPDAMPASALFSSAPLATCGERTSLPTPIITRRALDVNMRRRMKIFVIQNEQLS